MRLDGGRMRLGSLEIEVPSTIGSIVITWYDVASWPTDHGRAGQRILHDPSENPATVAREVAAQLT